MRIMNVSYTLIDESHEMSAHNLESSEEWRDGLDRKILLERELLGDDCGGG